MSRDPFYNLVIDRLENGIIDGTAFEACAADILRDEHQTLVPISGGTDSGLDGAVADAMGPAFPLITTTSPDAIGNVTRNLKSYLVRGGTRRKIIFATPRKLTPKRRWNLEERAREYGFELIQIYSSEAIADRIYANLRWSQELLGISGDPPAISTVPATRRPLIEVPLIGRSLDIEWMRSQPSDRLLVGHPGSGKTFLLYSLSREGWGGFVVSDNLSEIAAAIRSQDPQNIIVDDAHKNPELLVQLRHLRSETYKEFSIVAVSWPGDSDRVIEALAIPPSQVHELEPLSRSEIVQVIKAVGLLGPDRLVSEIVDQSGGQPGLAATLTQLCRQGSLREVALGDVLSRAASTTFRQLVGDYAVEVLATFAVGGRAGMSIRGVSEYLDIPFVDVRNTLIRLTAAGVVRQTPVSFLDQDTFAVWPEALAEILVRDVFFGQFGNLPFVELLDHIPSLRSASQTLVGAAHRGGHIEPRLLEEILTRADSSDAWEQYSALGKHQTRWILTNRPDLLRQISRVALQVDPETVLPHLLQQAPLDTRTLNQFPDHPLRVIEDWIQSCPPHSTHAIQRRSLLLTCVANWRDVGGGDADIASHMAAVALYPGYELRWIDPGEEMAIYWSNGLLPNETLADIVPIWSDAVKVWKSSVPESFKHWLNAIRSWLYPDRYNFASTDVQTHLTMRHEAEHQLTVMAQSSRQHAAVQSQISQLARSASLEDPSQMDEAFAVLFPERKFHNWEATHIARIEQVRRLAATWREEAPSYIVERLLQMLADQNLIDGDSMGFVPELLQELAATSGDFVEVLDGLTNESIVPSRCLEPLLSTLLARDPVAWKHRISEMVHIPFREGLALTALLLHPNPPEEDYALIEHALPRYAPQIEFLCAYSEIASNTVASLLRHPDSSVSTAAAIGEWLLRPQGVIRAPLNDQWKAAIRRSHDESNYWLGEILASDEALASDWINHQLREGRIPLSVEHSPPFSKSIAILSQEYRCLALSSVPASFTCSEMTSYIVGGDASVYEILLADDSLQILHLAPLRGVPTSKWGDLASIAAAKGYSHDEIVSAAFVSSFVYTGNESAFYDRFAASFEVHVSHSDPNVRAMAVLGRDAAKKNQERALMSERAEAIYGLGSNSIYID